MNRAAAAATLSFFMVLFMVLLSSKFVARVSLAPGTNVSDENTLR
jgi:hypothetical protein